MNYKVLILSIFSIFITVVSTAQNTKVVKTQNTEEELDNDTTLVIPADFDNSLDDMLRTWMVQKADSSNCTSSDDIVNVPDSVLKERLMKMPCLMEMPYNNAVRSFIDLYTVKKRKQVEYMLGMSDYYFPVFEQVIDANNLPLELKYLPIIESALNTRIISRMGAAGLWQLMIPTARMYGLEINSLVDERFEPVKATNAAARFLKDLYSIYGDWHLVIAAYNCGPGNVNKAIRRSGGKRDYWEIYPYLPAETRGYVPIFIAANYAMTYAAQHNMCKATVNMPVVTDTIVVKERIHLEQIAEVLNIPIEEVRLLNPQYKKDIIPGDIKPYTLRLPLAYANAFIDNYKDVVAYKADSLINNRRSEIEIVQATRPVAPGVSGHVTYHKVKSGETLGAIAAKYGVSTNKLRRWNNIKGSMIRPGQRLKIIK